MSALMGAAGGSPPGGGVVTVVPGKKALSQRSRACPRGSEVGVPLPGLPPAAHESGFPAPVMSLLPASQAVLQTRVGNDRSFSHALRWPNRGKYVKHAAPGMCRLPSAGLGRARPFLSQRS